MKKLLVILIMLQSINLNAETFGYSSTPNPDGYDAGEINENNGTMYNLPEDGTVTKITFYSRTSSGTTDIKACIWDSNKVLKAVSSPTTITTTLGWFDCTISNVELTAGNYIIGVIPGGNVRIYWEEPGVGDYVQYYGDGNNYASPVNFDEDSTYEDTAVNIYATYTPLAGGAAPKYVPQILILE